MLRGGWGPRAIVRLCWRGTRVLGLIGAGVMELLVQRPKTRVAQAAWVNGFFRRMLRLIAVEVEVEGEFPAQGAVITNHQSYLDIIVLGALHPCVFVSKAEVSRWPLVGWMTRTAGTVFVERGRGGSAAAASGQMRSAAEAGVPVVFFPEGTTSNGEGLLPFRGGLLAEARAAELPVWAGRLRYSVAGPAGVTVEDDVAYWGERNILTHMVRFLTLAGVRARVRFAAEPLRFKATDRKAAAVEARGAMLGLGDDTVERVRGC